MIKQQVQNQKKEALELRRRKEEEKKEHQR
jgi:hypothetical protein